MDEAGLLATIRHFEVKIYCMRGRPTGDPAVVGGTQEEMRIALHKVGKKRAKEKADLLVLPILNGIYITIVDS